jgi:hypothetical protein
MATSEEARKANLNLQRSSDRKRAQDVGQAIGEDAGGTAGKYSGKMGGGVSGAGVGAVTGGVIGGVAGSFAGGVGAIPGALDGAAIGVKRGYKVGSQAGEATGAFIGKKSGGFLGKNAGSNLGTIVDDATNPPDENTQRMRLNAFKLGNYLNAQSLNKKGGEIAGEWAGGAVGSFIPFAGTAIGAFLGRIIGKKLGVTGIAIISLLTTTTILIGIIIVFMLMFKTYCDTWTGWATDKVTLGVCQSLGSLQNIK